MSCADSSANHTTSDGLKRSLGFWDVVALGVNGMIGAGIFLLPGVIAVDLGPSAVFAVLIAGLIALLNAWCFADIAKHYADTGGPYLYARDYLGAFVGFEIGWLNWCSRMLSWAAIAHGFAMTLNDNHPSTFAYAATLLALVTGLSILNYRGVVFGARIECVQPCKASTHRGFRHSSSFYFFSSAILGHGAL
ncbi:MAG: amino acid permease [Myxococcales bacterium]|nr:MAG: amino acid permease [Myxococcales bacterium]